MEDGELLAWLFFLSACLLACVLALVHWERALDCAACDSE
jgi:hypothetical protein